MKEKEKDSVIMEKFCMDDFDFNCDNYDDDAPPKKPKNYQVHNQTSISLEFRNQRSYLMRVI